MTNPSKATVNVPAAGPYKSTAVNTNASEIEIETLALGSSTEAEPLISVRTARKIHCSPTDPRGTRYSWISDSRIAKKPRPMTTRR